MKAYSLKIRTYGSTFMQYVYNTGRVHWKKEEEGHQLTDSEKEEVEQNFIAKCLALGYLLSKHKNSGHPYAVWAMETTMGEDGEHLGGTGKSMLLRAIRKMRCQHTVDGQKLNEKNMQFMLQGVVKGVTDNVFMDDVNHHIDIHKFMNMVTGDMYVDVKNNAPFSLDYQESPKICFTSNHAIGKFDDSLNRRIWFAAFSDYYHSDSRERGLKLRSPRSEFGKDLIDQYTPEEMNHFYNFMLNCISAWHKIHERVQPPMEDIMKRTLALAIGEDFLWWAQEWFTEERLNTLVEFKTAYDACKDALSRRASDFMNSRRFKDKLMKFCMYMDWEFNPRESLKTASDRQNNRITAKVNNEVKYYFYIQTPGGAGGPGTDDQPPF